MLYILLTIFLNVLLSVLFKYFPKWKVDALQAILVNYVVCVITGSLFIGKLPYNTQVIHEIWLPWALGLGIAFISLFNLIAYCTRIDGITTTTIANKLSLAIPVITALLYMGESLTAVKFIGLIATIPAIILTAYEKSENNKQHSYLIPFLLFAGSGFLDTMMNYVQKNFLISTDSQALFPIYCFSSAGTIGVLYVIALLLLKKIKLSVRNVWAGIAIGIPNYFSIYFLIRSLNQSGMPSSVTFPVLNMGVMIASTVTAIVLFREKMNLLRIVGLVLSLAAIACISMGR